MVGDCDCVGADLSITTGLSNCNYSDSFRYSSVTLALEFLHSTAESLDAASVLASASAVMCIWRSSSCVVIRLLQHICLQFSQQPFLADFLAPPFPASRASLDSAKLDLDELVRLSSSEPVDADR